MLKRKQTKTLIVLNAKIVMNMDRKSGSLTTHIFNTGSFRMSNFLVPLKMLPKKPFKAYYGGKVVSIVHDI